MKQISILALFLAASLSLMAQGNKKPNGKGLIPGFRTMTWGVHIDSTMKNGRKVTFLKSTTTSDPNAYVLENEDMTIGTVTLNNIYYYFTDRGRFTKVMMVADKKYFTDMKYILSYKYDDVQPPQISKTSNGSTVYQWTVDDVRITLTDGSADGFMTVTFFMDFNLHEFKIINSGVSDF